MEGPTPSLPPLPPFTGREPYILAPYLYGLVLMFGMWCIVLTQAMTFYTRQGSEFKDPVGFRGFIAFLLAAVTAQVGLGLKRLYQVAVLMMPQFLIPDALADPIMNCVVVTTVHSFYIHRCYKLSQSRIVLVVLSILVAAQVAVSFVLFYYSSQPVLRLKGPTWIITLSSLTLVVDSFISAVVILSLIQQRTGKKNVDAVLVRIMRLTVQSFVPVVFLNTLILIGSTRISLLGFFGFGLPPMGQFYAVSVLSTVNSRSNLRRQLEGERGGGGRLSIHTNTGFQRSSAAGSRSHEPGESIRLEFYTSPTTTTTDPTNSISPRRSSNDRLALAPHSATWPGVEKGARQWDPDVESLAPGDYKNVSRTFPEQEQDDGQIPTL